METKSPARRVSWVDSAGMPSRIHLTDDGLDTICGGHAEYIKDRELAKSPNRRGGRSNYCTHCFAKKDHTLPWDPRCKDVEWIGPYSARFKKGTCGGRAR